MILLCLVILYYHTCHLNSALIKTTPNHCQYNFESRGEIPIKGLGNLVTYFVEPCQVLGEMFCINQVAIDKFND